MAFLSFFRSFLLWLQGSHYKLDWRSDYTITPTNGTVSNEMKWREKGSRARLRLAQRGSFRGPGSMGEMDLSDASKGKDGHVWVCSTFSKKGPIYTHVHHCMSRTWIFFGISPRLWIRCCLLLSSLLVLVQKR
ncbi:hypothetical protein BJ166DRAFT_3355 [Pestalotiopsis sp. NC0098]|nr:hypothetical protein BJ166DRAFT_3355 [Pestalotiopsis sp. NC0098]